MNISDSIIKMTFTLHVEKRYIFPTNNIANQRTVAVGGFGSTVIANGQATAGNTFGRG